MTGEGGKSNALSQVPGFTVSPFTAHFWATNNYSIKGESTLLCTDCNMNNNNKSMNSVRSV